MKKSIATGLALLLVFCGAFSSFAEASSLKPERSNRREDRDERGHDRVDEKREVDGRSRAELPAHAVAGTSDELFVERSYHSKQSQIISSTIGFKKPLNERNDFISADKAICRERFWPFIGRRGWRLDGKILPLISQIEDNHGDANAQLAASELLDQINSDRGQGPLLIGVEGAWSPLHSSLETLATLPPGEWRTRWWKRLLWRGDLTGEEYWLLSRAPSGVTLVGIDDSRLHSANTEARMAVESSRQETKRYLDSLCQRANRLKLRLYPEGLLKIDRSFAMYHQNAIPSEQLAKTILNETSLEWLKNVAPNLARLALASKFSIGVDAVRSEVLTHLAQTLSPTEATHLLSAPRGDGGKLLLNNILRRAEKSGASLPLTQHYEWTRTLMDDMEPARLSQEIDSIQFALPEYAGSEHSSVARLVRIDLSLAYLQDLVSLKFTPTQWDNYLSENTLKNMRNILISLKNLESEAGVPPMPSPLLPPSFSYVKKNAELFYRLAVARDRAMATRLLNEARRLGTERCVLIAGGFHTPGMTELFRQWGAPFEVFCPIPRRAPRPTLRQMDRFQSLEGRKKILLDTARELKQREGDDALKKWLETLPFVDRRMILRSPAGSVFSFSRGKDVFWKFFRRWISALLSLIQDLWESHQRLKSLHSNDNIAWATLTSPISPVTYLFPPSPHHTPGEGNPDVPKEEYTHSTDSLQQWVNESQWRKVEHQLLSLGTGRGNARRMGEAFMKLQEQERDTVASKISTRALGFLAQGLMDFFKHRDLERVYARKDLCAKILGFLTEIQSNPTPEQTAENLQDNLDNLIINLKEEASEVLAKSVDGSDGLMLLADLDPDTTTVIREAQATASAATRLATQLKSLAGATPLNRPNIKTLINQIRTKDQGAIQKLVFPTAIEDLDVSGWARTKGQVYKEWSRLTRSLDPLKKKEALAAWRAEEAISRAILRGELINPLEDSLHPDTSPYGLLEENKTVLDRAAGKLRTDEFPVLALSLPYEEGKWNAIEDLASALARTHPGVPGPRRLLTVRYANLGNRPGARAKALGELFVKAGALGSTGLVIDLDEMSPLLGSLDRPFEHLLQTWRGIDNRPPLLFVSSNQNHQRFLNVGESDQVDVIQFPTGRESVQTLLDSEAARIHEGVGCNVEPKTIRRLVDAVFSAGTVDFAEAIKALRFAAAEAVLNTAAGAPANVRPEMLKLDGEVPLRDLPVARQVRIVLGRVSEEFAGIVNPLYADLENLTPDSPFYSGALARVLHTIGLGHMFPKEEGSAETQQLSQQEIDLEVERARQFFDDHLFGLERQKADIINTYIKHDLVQKGLPNPSPASIRCLVGPPSAGKTEMARLLAKFTEKNLIKIDAGGASSVEEIVGTIGTYVGAEPGRIELGMEEFGTDDLIVFIDEIDKGSPEFLNALIRLMTLEQLLQGRYHSFGVPHRRLKIICAANNWDRIPQALKSRMERTEFFELSPIQLKKTAARFIWPKTAGEFQFPPERIRCDDFYSIINLLVNDYLNRPDLRELQRLIARVHEAANLKALEKRPRYKGYKRLKEKPILINQAFIRSIFGPPILKEESLKRGDEPGEVTGLGVKSAGVGTLLPVQVLALPLDQVPGPNLVMTGSAAETMQASGEAVLEALKEMSKRANNPISNVDMRTFRLHIHLPPITQNVDGPSAGVATTLAAVSAITGRRVNPQAAFTGEISPDLQILSVGGIAEKISAGIREGNKMLSLPSQNLQNAKTYLEQQGRCPSLIEINNQQTYFIPKKIEWNREKNEIKLNGNHIPLPKNVSVVSVRGGTYITSESAAMSQFLSKMSQAFQPIVTLVFHDSFENILNDVRLLLPTYPSIDQPLTSVKLGETITEDSTQPLGENPSVSPPRETVTRLEGPPTLTEKLPTNIYLRSIQTPFYSGNKTINPADFLNEKDIKTQKEVIQTLWDAKTPEALALLEALLRALWVLNPRQAGVIFNDLFAANGSSLFSPLPEKVAYFGFPFFAHMTVAQGSVNISAYIRAQKALRSSLPKDSDFNRINFSNQNIESLLSQLGAEDIKAEHQMALSKLNEIPPPSSGESPDFAVRRMYWENRKEKLELLLNKIQGIKTLANSNPNPEELKRQFLHILSTYRQFMDQDLRSLEEHTEVPLGGGTRHPILASAGVNGVQTMLPRVLNGVDQAMGHQGAQGRRLTLIRKSLTTIDSLVFARTFRNHSDEAHAHPMAAPQWAKGAASAVAETLSTPGNRVVTLVVPSKHRRKELANSLAACINNDSSLPIFVKTMRIVSIDFSKYHTMNAEESFEVIHSLIIKMRGTESGILYIDLPSFKSWAGSSYFKAMQRLLRTASEPSLHPPLTLVFASDSETNTQTADTVTAYGTSARVVRFPDPPLDQIVQVLTEREGGAQEEGPLSFAPNLWANGFSDGRLPLDLDECVAIFEETIGYARQQEKSTVTEEILTEVIKERQKRLTEHRTLVKRAEKEIPLISNPSAKRRGEEFLARLKTLGAGDPETVIVSKYLEWLLKWDWNPKPPPPITLKDMEIQRKRAIKVMDKQIFGQKKFKRRVLEMYMAYLWKRYRGLNPTMPIIALIGPYGSGKTSAARVIAEVFNFAFEEFDMSAESDPQRVTGFESHIVGAQPGEPFILAVNAFLRAVREGKEEGYMAMLIDEFEKAVPSHKGDPREAMIHLLDPEQRDSVFETYLRLMLDWRRVMFILTMNNLDINPALVSRMEIVEVPYLEEDEMVGLASGPLLEKGAKTMGISLIDSSSPPLEASRSARALDFGGPQDRGDLFKELLDGWVSGGPRELRAMILALLESAVDENRVIAQKKGYAYVPPLTIRVGDLPRLLGSRPQGPRRDMALGPVSTAGEALYYGETGSPSSVFIWGREISDEPGGLHWARAEVESVNPPKDEIEPVRRFQESLQVVWSLASKRFPQQLAGKRWLVSARGAPTPHTVDGSLAALVALASRAFNHPISRESAFLGEIEINGRLRPIGGDLERRLLRARTDGILETHLNTSQDELIHLMHKHPRLAGIVIRNGKISLCLPNEKMVYTEPQWIDPINATVSRKPIHRPPPGRMEDTLWSKELTTRLLQKAKDLSFEIEPEESGGILRITISDQEKMNELLSFASQSLDQIPRFFISDTVDDVLNHLNLPGGRSTPLNPPAQKGFIHFNMLGLTLLLGLVGFVGSAGASSSVLPILTTAVFPFATFPYFAKILMALGFSVFAFIFYHTVAGINPSGLSSLPEFAEGLSTNHQQTLISLVFQPHPNNRVEIKKMSLQTIEQIKKITEISLPEAPVKSIVAWDRARIQINTFCSREIARRTHSLPPPPLQETPALLPKSMPPLSSLSMTLRSRELGRRQS